MSTIGWTVSEWITAQKESSAEEGLSRLVAHVSTFSKSDTAWISIATSEQLTAYWKALQAIPNCKDLPLYGVPFAPKDNIDVTPFETTVACPAFAYKPSSDAEIIKLLKCAGAIPLGKTNMDQFASGLTGTRTPYGAVPSALSDKHCSGGSSAGSANVVSKGQAPFSLGTDTGGSGRVPAMHNNIIGLKPTRGALSTTGVVPACKELDCVSIFALTLPDAEMIFDIVAKYDLKDSYSRPLPESMLRTFGKKPRFAIPDIPLFFGDTEQVGSLYDDAVAEFKKFGVEIVKADFTPMYKLGACLYEGPWVAERYTVVRDIITTQPESMDPTVCGIINGSTKFSAADMFDWEHKRKDLVREIETKFASFDGFLVPTAPISPTIAAVQADYVSWNSKQGTYTNFVNYSDYSALSLPAGFRPDGMPFGITLVSRKHNDFALLDLAAKYLLPKERRLGALSRVSVAGESDKLIDSLLPKPNTMPVCVVGAHLSGMSLNWQLTSLGGELSRVTKTSENYRLYALKGTVPAKPGIRRVSADGFKLEVEVWDLPIDKVGVFLSMIPSPLGLGRIELEDSEWVTGFVCEEIGYSDAKDVTKFGGWRYYINSL